MADFVGAVDQGTTSTRFMIFDHSGAEVARHQLEHSQILPRPGGKTVERYGKCPDFQSTHRLVHLLGKNAGERAGFPGEEGGVN